MIQTTYFLFREKSETVRTCDWKVAKNVYKEDDDTCPGTESGATDDCDDRRNITHRSPAEPRIGASTPGHRNQDVQVASPPPSRHAASRYGAHLGKCNASTSFVYLREGNPPLKCLAEISCEKKNADYHGPEQDTRFFRGCRPNAAPHPHRVPTRRMQHIAIGCSSWYLLHQAPRESLADLDRSDRNEAFRTRRQ